MNEQARSAGKAASPPLLATADPVVVGVDSSRAAFAAVEYAAGEALRRDLPLTLVHAFSWPLFYPPLTGGYDPNDPLPRTKAGMMLTDVAERIQSSFPDLTVAVELLEGHAAAALVERSRQAGLLVVGHRGEGGFAGLLAGSAAINVASHAHCPVVVVRGASVKADAPVVLGVDGSADACRTAEFAFDEAARRGAALTVVGVWPPDRGWPDALTEHVTAVEADEERVLADSLAGWRDKYPAVTVRRRLVRGHTRQALIDASDQAQLAIVGSRGRGGFTGLLLGSVSQAVLHHAACPVAIVHHARARS